MRFVRLIATMAAVLGLVGPAPAAQSPAPAAPSDPPPVGPADPTRYAAHDRVYLAVAYVNRYPR